MRLLEYGLRGDRVSPQDYKYLYHLCDHHSFAYSVEANALKTRGSELSTTYDAAMNHIVGKSHLAFKFVLDAAPLITRYGAHYFDDRGYVGSELTSHNEREIRIETRVVEPLDQYLLGVCVMFDLFSESGFQWMLYRNPATVGGMFSHPSGAASRSIDYIISLRERNIPVWNYQMGKFFTAEQKQYLDDVKKVSDMNLSFTDSLELITQSHSVKDHTGEVIDPIVLKRMHMSPAIVKLLNSYYADKPLHDTDLTEVRSLIVKIIDMLRVGDNFKQTAISMIEQHGLFSIWTEPVQWGSIIQSIMATNYDDLLSDCKYYEKEIARKSANFHDLEYMRHTATSFGRMAER